MLRSLFVDFNSYFASVEQQLDPALRGRPVGVVPVMADSSCCIAASYEAKAFGIKTGTRVSDAKRRCPDIVLILADHARYVQVHQQALAVVDRIVPATSDAVREAAEQELGVQDPTALGVEAFWEWVIEDRFADTSDGPLLAAQGVRVTPEVHVYEDAKLRMLNGSHSVMALIGAVTGRPYIASCIEMPHIRQFVHRLMTREVAPYLQRSDWMAYRDALIARFGNPHLRHSVHQVATDSSLKIPLRWVPSVQAQLAQGQSVEHHALATAIWLRHGLAVDESGQPYTVNDPLADWLQANAAGQREAPEASLQGLLSRTDLWGQTLPTHSHWRARVAHWHRVVLDVGVDRAIEQLLSTEP